MNNRIIFWNVDTQYDFMRADGKLYVEGAERIEGNLEKITEIARKLNYKIINTADWHDENTKEISDNPDYMNTFPEHCMAGTKGAEYIDATNPMNPYVIDWRDKGVDAKKIEIAKEIVMYKDAFDVFEGTRYADKVMDIVRPDVVIAYGVATNVCVDFEVMGLRKRGVEVYAIENAMKGLPTLPLEDTLDKWKNAGVYMAKTEDIPKILYK